MAKRKATQRQLQTPEVRREQMISAAQECMREKGLHATKVTEIAKRAGVSVGLLYHLFPNKDALIEAMMDANVDATMEQANSRRQSTGFDLYDYLSISSTPVDSLVLETLAEQWRHQTSGGRLSGKQNETLTRIRDFASSALPADGEPDLDLRIRLIIAMNFGLGTLLALDNYEANQRLAEISEILGRAIANRSTVDFSALFPSNSSSSD